MWVIGEADLSAWPRSGGRDLRSSAMYPRDFGREVASQHLSYMETWLASTAASMTQRLNSMQYIENKNETSKS